MNAHGQVSAALLGSLVVLGFAGNWLPDMRNWVKRVTGQLPGTGVVPPVIKNRTRPEL